MIRKLRLPCTLFAFLAIASACNPIHARVTKFEVNGGGVVEYIPLPGDQAVHWAVGNATHLGEYYGVGIVRPEMFTSPATASFSSAVPFVFVGADGDRLAFHYGRTDQGAVTPGNATLFPTSGGKFGSVWVAEFTPVPELCTGKFSGVTGGSFIMIARTDEFVLGAKDPVKYTWSGEGYLKWGHGENNWKGFAAGSTAPDPDQPGVDCETFAGMSSIAGPFTAEGCHMLDFSLAVAGNAVWIAQNGDKLNITYTGQVYFTGDPDLPFGIVFNMIADGGTGRFANAFGAARGIGGFTGVPGGFVFEFEGTLYPQAP